MLLNRMLNNSHILYLVSTFLSLWSWVLKDSDHVYLIFEPAQFVTHCLLVVVSQWRLVQQLK